MFRNLTNRSRIPETDFVDKKYDRKFDGRPAEVILMLSTPRSGSTMLSDLLWRNIGLITHEYFQPHQYAPILSERWNVRKATDADFWPRYKEKLIKHRTGSDGILGCNTHASHLKNYIASGLLDELPHRVFWIYRRDIIAQAISYEIAHQTGRWSSEFSHRRKPAYKFKAINERIAKLSNDNVLIRAFLSRYVSTWDSFAYEDLVENPQQVVERVAARKITDFQGPQLKKQANGDSVRFKNSFVDDLLQAAGLLKIG